MQQSNFFSNAFSMIEMIVLFFQLSIGKEREKKIKINKKNT